MTMIDLPSRKKDLLVESMGKCMKGGIEKRLIRALVAGSMSAIETKRIIAKDVKISVQKDVVQGRKLMREEAYEERVSRETAMSEKMRSGGVRSSLQRAEKDWVFFCDNGFLPLLRKTSRRVTDAAIQECVAF